MYYRWMAVFLEVLVLLSCSAWFARAQTLCPNITDRPSCVCQHPKGVIDLTPLANPASEGTPRFTGLEDPNSWLYSFNPCYKYTDQCQNVYICQTKAGSTEKYSIATGGEQIMTDSDEVYLTYTGDGDRYSEKDPGGLCAWTTHVFLHCNQSQTKNATIVTLGDSQNPTYRFDLYSCHACPGGCVGAAGGVAAGVVGIVLIVLFIVGVATYFIAGAVIMRVKYEAAGTDLIPNKHFWVEVPLLIKDGVLFTFSPCVNHIRERRGGYSKM